MKIINNKGEGYPEEERKIQIGVIRKNVLDSIEQLLLGRTMGSYYLILLKQIPCDDWTE